MGAPAIEGIQEVLQAGGGAGHEQQVQWQGESQGVAAVLSKVEVYPPSVCAHLEADLREDQT